MLSRKRSHAHKMKYCETIADSLSKADQVWAVYQGLIPTGEMCWRQSRLNNEGCAKMQNAKNLEVS
jgi:hypothetical protein